MEPCSPEDITPDATTCQSLIDKFAETTGADQALSQCFLQNSNWKLEVAVNMFYEAQGKHENAELAEMSEAPLIVYDSLKEEETSLKRTTKPPGRFSLLSWNIDGLDKHNLKKRTKGVAKLIEMGCYDVVFLQEVVPDTLEYLESKLPHYRFLFKDTSNYFCVTLLRRFTVYFDECFQHPFPNSRMGRSLLQVNAHIGNLHLRLLNTHLESTAEFSAARTVQLQNCMKMLTQGEDYHVSILAGDLNIRDNEVSAVGIPDDACDLWEQCGSREECKYTWDLLRNHNKSMPGRFQPRMRFDRAYLHQRETLVTPRHFGLEGIQKVAGTQSFPSDHWGIQAYFHIRNIPPSDENSVTDAEVVDLES